jgi:hypothetical protein
MQNMDPVSSVRSLSICFVDLSRQQQRSRQIAASRTTSLGPSELRCRRCQNNETEPAVRNPALQPSPLTVMQSLNDLYIEEVEFEECKDSQTSLLLFPSSDANRSRSPRLEVEFNIHMRGSRRGTRRFSAPTVPMLQFAAVQTDSITSSASSGTRQRSKQISMLAPSDARPTRPESIIQTALFTAAAAHSPTPQSPMSLSHSAPMSRENSSHTTADSPRFIHPPALSSPKRLGTTTRFSPSRPNHLRTASYGSPLNIQRRLSTDQLDAASDGSRKSSIL